MDSNTISNNKNGIAIAGNIITDVVNTLDFFPEVSMLANVLDSVVSVGGCVPNTIIDIAKIDPSVPLSAIGLVGADDYGKILKDTLSKYGIDTSMVKVTDKCPTSNTQVMSDSRTGTRTFFYSKGTNAHFGIDDIDVDNLKCDIFHIGYLLLLDKFDEPDSEYGTKMARLLSKIQAKGIKTSIDAISKDTDDFKPTIEAALKYCDYVVMNEIECCKVSGLDPRNADGTINKENIRKTMELFFDLGVKEKVVIHCCEAGFLMNADKNMIVVPSLELPKGYIKGSVGAGDSYAAACLYGFFKEFDDTYILEFASAVAACNLSEPDAISGVRSKAETEELMKKFDRQVI